MLAGAGITVEVRPLPALQRPEAARDFLQDKGWPGSLADSFIANLERTPLRYYLIDDSTSMQGKDGQRCVDVDGAKTLCKCSRWEELADSLRFHIEFSKAALAPTEFRFINCPDPFLVGHEEDEDVGPVLQLLDTLPEGETPLCKHIIRIAREISELQTRLLLHNQRVCVVIATDGESSDGDVCAALEHLKGLPCWVIIRLCTDDERVVEYWNGVDERIDLCVDVLDDLVSEAKEVRRANPWLAYGEALHRMREFGVSYPEMDLLDEGLMDLETMRGVCALIFGHDVLEHFTRPEKDWRGFLADVSQGNNSLPKVWCPGDGKLRNWINTAQLHRCYKKGSSRTATATSPRSVSAKSPNSVGTPRSQQSRSPRSTSSASPRERSASTCIMM